MSSAEGNGALRWLASWLYMESAWRKPVVGWRDGPVSEKLLDVVRFESMREGKQ